MEDYIIKKMDSLACFARRLGVDAAGFRRNVLIMSGAADFVRFRPSLLEFEKGKSLEEVVLSYLARLSEDDRKEFFKIL